MVHIIITFSYKLKITYISTTISPDMSDCVQAIEHCCVMYCVSHFMLHTIYYIAYLVLVSERSPVTLSTAVLSNTPFCSPMFKNSPPMETGSAATPTVPSGAPWPISTIQSDSGEAGRACMLSGCRQSCNGGHVEMKINRSKTHTHHTHSLWDQER